jgi:tetratricopeptide (TPR) repeat protein
VFVIDVTLPRESPDRASGSAQFFPRSIRYSAVDTLASFMVFLAMAIDKQTITREAQKFITKGQYDKAIAEWKKLLKESPNDANIHNTIGDLCLKKNAKAEAVDAYKRAADLLAEDGFTSKAIALYKKVLNIDPKKIDVHLALGDLNADKGLTGNALESYKVAADHYTHQKDMVKALGIYQKMADLNPSNIAFRIKLGDMYSKQRMTAEATKAYLDAADVHMEKEAFKDARQLFEKVLAIDPENKAVYHKAGVVYFKEGKFTEACKALKPAFESKPASRELADIYLEALTKAGKENEAEQVIRKILAEDSSRAELREKLYLIYVGKKDYDKALEVASAFAGVSVEKGEPEGAIEILKKFIAFSPHFSPGRQKLAELYIALNRGNDAAATLLQSAEILADEGDEQGAKAALHRALEIEPDMAEAKDLLGRLAQSAPAPPRQSRPVRQEAPTESAVFTEHGPAIELPAAPEPEAAVYESPVATPLTPPVPAGEAEDPAIAAAFTEIDVLVKYGLATKALEQLEALARKFPESVQVRIKLRDIYGDIGQMSKAAAHMLALADLYSKRGMPNQALEALQSALSIDPSNAAVLSRLGIAQTAAAPAPPAGIGALEEVVVEPTSPPRSPFEEPRPSVPRPGEYTPAFEETASVFDVTETTEPAPVDEIVMEGLDEQIPPAETEGAFSEKPPAAAMPVAEPESRAFVEEETPSAGIMPQEPAAEIDISEIWAEAEFYYQQGLFDEAKKHYARIIESNPGERRAIERLADISREEENTKEFTKLAEAVESLEGALSSEPAGRELPLSVSDEQAVRSLMSEIAELKTPKKKEVPRPEREAAPPAQFIPPKIDRLAAAASTGPAENAAAEDFFDLGAELTAENGTSVPGKKGKGSDDFFDLASELRDELSGIAVPSRPAAGAEEQSLDEIFEEFKRGVEQQSTKEDVDTHYNLGVAYKEMGLLDDAIGEFNLTPEGEPKYVQGRYMLGLCYMEKGEYENAIGELQNALNSSEQTGEDETSRIGIHYDLGLAYQGAGNISNALNEFQKVQSLNPEYRDTRAKLKELKQGGYISLDQLKDDIEKEISSKFLEEGERIEREEKHRKNERVRN